MKTLMDKNHAMLCVIFMYYKQLICFVFEE